MRTAAIIGTLLFAPWLAASELEAARDAQDAAKLEALIAPLSEAAARNGGDARAQYRLALARSYLAEVAMELRDKARAKAAAEAGIPSAERAVALAGHVAEHHRILGTLCGQVLPANVLTGLKYGRCAMDSVNKAIELDPKSSTAYLSRAVGNYYLPEAFGGGAQLAVRDCQKAIELDAKSAEAYLWLGVALRKLNRNQEAQAAIRKSLELNPRRVWAKNQLEKTPAK
jgi:tetratricopeptide (TPR) repeat protein